MSNLSREEAKKIVNSILVENGGISPEHRAITPQPVLDAMESLRRQLAATTSLLARDLYSKDTRFVFELIQNADDNNYSISQAKELVPGIAFSVYPDKIFIDSNENGFNAANVKAICSTGQSTKKSSAGYIGEKGIGFKSVFKVASKVHIQSEPFSFAFEHRDGDDGLGMITPMNEPHTQLPNGVRTRIVLHLKESSRNKHVDDLKNLPDTLLLFLKKIKILRISIFDQASLLTNTTYRYNYSFEKKIGSIEKSDFGCTPSFSRYHIYSKKISDLPDDEARTGINQADIILAFPVDNQDNPIIDQQYTFAYLPLRKAGFSFIIQSDFITQASREDVFESQWNKRLLEGVASTFIEAVRGFSKIPKLQYSWLRYLPSKEISGSFWSKLRPMIMELIEEECLFKPWMGDDLFSPLDISRVPTSFLDQSGQPLFTDPFPLEYCSPRYEAEVNVDILEEMGIDTLSFEEVMDILGHDLAHIPSTMKSASPEGEWHTRFANWVMEEIGDDASLIEDLKIRRIVPTKQLGWIAPASKKHIAFPEADGYSIPEDLNVVLIETEATRNQARAKLFSHIGISKLSAQNVKERIFSRHSNATGVTGFGQTGRVSCEQSIEHLLFLFCTDRGSKHEKLGDSRKFSFYDDEGQLILGSFGSIYFQSDRHLGARKLFRERDKGAVGGVGGPPVRRYLNSSYLNSVLEWNSTSGPKFVKWLDAQFSINDRPKFRTSDDLGLDPSQDLEDIINHRADVLIEVLKEYWEEIEPILEHVANIQSRLRASLVPCENGSRIPLERTWLPLPELRKRAGELGVTRSMPFLRLPSTSKAKSEIEETSSIQNSWGFLQTFAVGMSLGVNFYLSILDQIRNISTEHISFKTALEVLRYIGRSCESETDKSLVRQKMKSKTICIPSGVDKQYSWINLDQCVFKAPFRTNTVTALASFAEFEDLLIRQLFQNVLGINDLTWIQSLGELVYLKYNTTDLSLETVIPIYQYVAEAAIEANVETIRSKVEEYGLIFVPTASFPPYVWRSPSSCLWAKSTPLVDKTAIALPYPSLKDFFTQSLQVEAPNISMMIDEIIRLIKTKSPQAMQDQVKRLVFAINSMNPDTDDLKRLHNRYFLSIRNPDGTRTLATTDDDFAINDRDKLNKLFGAKIPMLLFSLGEVQELEPFFKALNLEHKYLSKLVEERSIGDGALDLDLTKSLREKATAIYRCAARFKSPRMSGNKHSFFKLLNNFQVFRSEAIYKTLSITLGGQTFVSQQQMGNLHIEETGTVVKLVVPVGESALRHCLVQQLPKRLCGLFGLDDPKAETSLTRIFMLDHLPIINDMLEEDGIGEVEVPTLDPEEHVIAASSATLANAREPMPSVVLSREPTQSRASSRGPVPSVVPPRETAFGVVSARTPNELNVTVPTSSSPGNDVSLTREVSDQGSSSLFNFRPGLPLQATPTSSSRGENIASEYSKLLQFVVTAARHSSLPTISSSDELTNQLGALSLAGNVLSSLVAPFGEFSRNPKNYNTKIGAAGELYVFELLSKLGLPEFGLANWKSTIRHETCVHRDYSDMMPWSGFETADITYRDTSQRLTRTLKELGYFAGSGISDTQLDELSPEYFLEVKTTLRDCNERFFMSGSQYERMKGMRLSDSRSNQQLYIIMRVFNLGQPNMGMRMYVDPDRHRQEGTLDFKAETWTVSPVQRVSSTNTPNRRGYRTHAEIT